MEDSTQIKARILYERGMAAHTAGNTAGALAYWDSRGIVLADIDTEQTT